MAIKRRKLKVYISAPITGYDLAERKAWFAIAARQLIIAGYTPVSPLPNGLPDTASHADHMKADLKMLLQCDAYVRSRQWAASAGCCIECQVADACGITLLYEL